MSRPINCTCITSLLGYCSCPDIVGHAESERALKRYYATQESIGISRKDEVIQDFAKILDNFSHILNFGIETESKENTPQRLQKMYLDELLVGYTQNPTGILSKRFPVEKDDMIIVKSIPFVSLCSHHWLPFIGEAHIGYIPNKEAVGLSKIPRLVQCFAKRFQIQENMTSQIADSLYKELSPKGCIVVVEAEHLCAQIRGVQSKGTKMQTSSICGCFEKPEIKDEFLKLIKD